MRRKGVLYDVGRVLYGNWRPVFDREVVRRELTVIRDELHCTSVKICGRDLDRLAFATEVALGLGLEVWFCPELWGKPRERTLAHIAAAAALAERLRQRAPDRLVFSVATEASLFVPGIIAGRTLLRRLANLRGEIRAGRHVAPLKAFLGRANDSVRRVFGGPVTYASLPFEPVDWDLFDIVGVDLYRDAHNEDRFVDALQRFFVLGKPVVVTEFGMRTYRGADSDGNLGLGIVDRTSSALHLIPGLGRFVRPRLVKGEHVRDEALQARRITEDLRIFDDAGVDGAFVCTFVEQLSTHHPDPRYDLDMSALSLVKTHPDFSWTPKQSFHAVADYYAEDYPDVNY